MKKLTNKRKSWLVRHARRLHARKLRTKKKKLRRRQIQYSEYIEIRQTQPEVPRSVVNGRVLIPLPEAMNLSDCYQDTMKFIGEFKATALPQYDSIHVDFTTLRSITPAAALVLASELDRWRRIKGFRLLVMDIDRWDPEIRRLLY